MKAGGNGLEISPRRVLVAVTCAVISLCAVGDGIFWLIIRTGGVKVQPGAPAGLAAAMGGLFGGGLVSLVVLIAILRWRPRPGS